MADWCGGLSAQNICEKKWKWRFLNILWAEREKERERAEKKEERLGEILNILWGIYESCKQNAKAEMRLEKEDE